jgi:hypothetical protein
VQDAQKGLNVRKRRGRVVVVVIETGVVLLGSDEVDYLSGFIDDWSATLEIADQL